MTTKIQHERAHQVKTYLSSVGKLYFKNNRSTRRKINMNIGQLRDAVLLLEKEGVLARYTSKASTYTYTVDLEMIGGHKK